MFVQEVCPRCLSKTFVQDVCPRRLSKMSQQNLKQDSFQRHPGWLKVLKKHLEETSWTNVLNKRLEQTFWTNVLNKRLEQTSWTAVLNSRLEQTSWTNKTYNCYIVKKSLKFLPFPPDYSLFHGGNLHFWPKFILWNPLVHSFQRLDGIKLHFDTGFGFHKHGFWDTSKNAMIFGKMEAFSFFPSHFFNIFSLMLAKNSIWNDFPRSIEALASIRKKFGLNSLPNNQRILTQVCRNFHSPDLDFWLYSLPSWQEVAW